MDELQDMARRMLDLTPSLNSLMALASGKPLTLEQKRRAVLEASLVEMIPTERAAALDLLLAIGEISPALYNYYAGQINQEALEEWEQKILDAYVNEYPKYEGETQKEFASDYGIGKTRLHEIFAKHKRVTGKDVRMGKGRRPR